MNYKSTLGYMKIIIRKLIYIYIYIYEKAAQFIYTNIALTFIFLVLYVNHMATVIISFSFRLSSVTLIFLYPPGWAA